MCSDDPLVLLILFFALAPKTYMILMCLLNEHPNAMKGKA
jgi:hypothetical protein